MHTPTGPAELWPPPTAPTNLAALGGGPARRGVPLATLEEEEEEEEEEERRGGARNPLVALSGGSAGRFGALREGRGEVGGEALSEAKPPPAEEEGSGAGAAVVAVGSAEGGGAVLAPARF